MFRYVWTADEGFDNQLNKNLLPGADFNPMDITLKTVEKRMLGLAKTEHYFTPAFKLYTFHPVQINPVIIPRVAMKYPPLENLYLGPTVDIFISYDLHINGPEDVVKLFSTFSEYCEVKTCEGYVTREVDNYRMLDTVIDSIRDDFEENSFGLLSLMNLYYELSVRFKEHLMNNPILIERGIDVRSVLVSYESIGSKQFPPMGTDDTNLIEEGLVWKADEKIFMRFKMKEERPRGFINSTKKRPINCL